MLLRHAKSDRPSGVADHDRPLNRRGARDAGVVGTYLAHNALIPEQVLCSTAKRTRETWDLARHQLPESPPVNFEERIYEAEPEAILTLLRGTAQKIHSLLVVGHNPGIQRVALTWSLRATSRRASACTRSSRPALWRSSTSHSTNGRSCTPAPAGSTASLPRASWKRNPIEASTGFFVLTAFVDLLVRGSM